MFGGCFAVLATNNVSAAFCVPSRLAANVTGMTIGATYPRSVTPVARLVRQDPRLCYTVYI